MPGARTVVLDVVPDTSSAHHYGYTYVIGSGMATALPRRQLRLRGQPRHAGAHPAEARPALLAEMRRVAAQRRAVHLPGAPRRDGAEPRRLLFDYIQWLLKAPSQEQLAEHRRLRPARLRGRRRPASPDAGWATSTCPAGNLYNWLFMMVAKHYLISFRDEQAAEFERRLDHFYNLTFSATDRQEPAYRGVLRRHARAAARRRWPRWPRPTRPSPAEGRPTCSAWS